MEPHEFPRLTIPSNTFVSTEKESAEIKRNLAEGLEKAKAEAKAAADAKAKKEATAPAPERVAEAMQIARRRLSTALTLDLDTCDKAVRQQVWNEAAVSTALAQAEAQAETARQVARLNELVGAVVGAVLTSALLSRK